MDKLLSTTHTISVGDPHSSDWASPMTRFVGEKKRRDQRLASGAERCDTSEPLDAGVASSPSMVETDHLPEQRFANSLGGHSWDFFKTTSRTEQSVDNSLRYGVDSKKSGGLSWVAIA